METCMGTMFLTWNGQLGLKLVWKATMETCMKTWFETVMENSDGNCYGNQV